MAIKHLDYHKLLMHATELIKQSRRILVFTGAGISADSGLPTYRGIGGIYENRLTDEGLEIEEALSIHMFHRNPELVWKYLKQIISGVEGRTFNIAHEVLANLEKQKESFWIVTQNVDGFHTDAGSRNVVELHGNLRTLVCIHCGHTKKIHSYATLPVPPRCERCHHIMKPDVVLFGEFLPSKTVFLYERVLSQKYDVVMIIGTTGVFPYIYQPVYEAIARNIATIEINPSKTMFSDHVRIFLPDRAATVLENLYQNYLS